MSVPHTHMLEKDALAISDLYLRKTFLVLGGTGFLGKVFWCMLLHRFPDIGHIVLVVRAQKGRSSEQRFWDEVATSDAFSPLRAQHGSGFDAYLRSKLTITDGDISAPLCGLSVGLVATLRGHVHAVVNVAGVVDFNPPLDEALHANAFGATNLIALCKELGNAPLMHTSTAYVVGNRRGLVHEALPGTIPFPRAGEVDAAAWDAAREVQDGLDIVREVKARAKDGFRQSEFVAAARARLAKNAEPTTPHDVAYVAATEERSWVRARLVTEGETRAQHWGWPNTYTYTKSIGEQLIAASGLTFVIARPACCETTLRFPVPGWNEGLGTSAPIIYAVMKGQTQLISSDASLDFVPADLVCVGMALALAELLEGTHKPVYHFGAADVNPASSDRFAELIGIYKRQSYKARAAKKKPSLGTRLGQHIEATGVTAARFESFGPPAIARGLSRAASWLERTPARLHPWTQPLAHQAKNLAKREQRLAEVLQLFTPFTYVQKGPFDCGNTRAAFARLPEHERTGLLWDPQSIDWADYWTRIHMPCMEHKIIPWMDTRFAKTTKILRAHTSLQSAWNEQLARTPHAPALGALVHGELTWSTYAELDAQGGLEPLLGAASEETRAALCLSLASLGARYTLSENEVCVTLGPRTRGLGLSAGTLLPLLRGARVLHLSEKDPRAVARVLGRVRATMVVAPPSFWNSYAKHLKTRLPKGAPGAEVWARIDALALGRPKYMLSAARGLEPKTRTALRRMGLRVDALHGVELDTLPLLANGKALPGVQLHVDASEILPEGYGALRASVAEGAWMPTGDTARIDARNKVHIAGSVANTIQTRAGKYLQSETLEARLAACKAVRECVVVPVQLADGPTHTTRIGLLAVRNTSAFGGHEGYFNADRALREHLASWPADEQPAVVRLVDARLARLDSSGDVDRSASARKLSEMAEQGVDCMPRSVRPPVENRYALAPESDKKAASPVASSAAAPLLARGFAEVEERMVQALIRPRVIGDANIPHNRPVLIIANHTSHLDGPLVRVALGEYGRRVVVTAAADYFFEGSGAKKRLFSALSHVAPVARNLGAKESLDDLLAAWSRGAPMLVFPEGTRSCDGTLADFRPLIGQLVLKAGMSVLPVHIEGAAQVFPKGARRPHKGDVKVRIGQAISARTLAGCDPQDALVATSGTARLVAERMQLAVARLAHGEIVTSFSAPPTPSLRPADANTAEPEQA